MKVLKIHIETILLPDIWTAHTVQILFATKYDYDSNDRMNMNVYLRNTTKWHNFASYSNNSNISPNVVVHRQKSSLKRIDYSEKIWSSIFEIGHHKTKTFNDTDTNE